MPKKKQREVDLSLRETRRILEVNTKPYYHNVRPGLHLGYRQNRFGSSWVVRIYVGDGQYKVLNLKSVPDDINPADNVNIANFEQAKVMALTFYEKLVTQEINTKKADIYTIKTCLEDYLQDYKNREKQNIYRVEQNINHYILPFLSYKNINELTPSEVEQWVNNILKDKADIFESEIRSGLFNIKKTDKNNSAQINRVLVILKAALNLAYKRKKIVSNYLWRSIKLTNNHKDYDKYFTMHEARRLIQCAPLNFRPLIQAAFLTGCRYGELTELKVKDYKKEEKYLNIINRVTLGSHKSLLNEEGAKLFNMIVVGKSPEHYIFLKKSNEKWGKSHQQRPFKLTCIHAGLNKLTFQNIRHTYIFNLIKNNVPLDLIAKQLGHVNTRMLEMHYSKYISNKNEQKTVIDGLEYLDIV